MSDFVGILPIDEADDYERFLARDYNEEMIEHVEGRPEVRDVSLFMGERADVTRRSFGDGLPAIDDWAPAHYEFTGYAYGFDPAAPEDRDALRAELGYRADETVCVVSVGGSGVGTSLLRRVIEAHPLARERVPGLRMIVVAGPRIAPESLPRADGVEVREYVHNLHRHLAACDLGVVQGGLTTTMELTANGRPFLYFPLKQHFEQRIHVAGRLDRYGAGRRMEYDESPPEAIADAMAAELDRPSVSSPVEPGGARRAAERLAELL
jgi:predicted glycosyltransferase